MALLCDTRSRRHQFYYQSRQKVRGPVDRGNAYSFQAGGHPGPIRIRRGEGLTILPSYLQVQAVGGSKKFATLLEATVQALVSQTLPTREWKTRTKRTNFQPGPYKLQEFFIQANPPKGMYFTIRCYEHWPVVSHWTQIPLFLQKAQILQHPS